MSRIARTAALGLGLIGAVTASQGPEFAQQYRQRLGGAIDELRRVVERFDTDARTQGETRDSAIARLRANPDPLASHQGAAMQGHVERLARLDEHRRVMMEAGSFARVGLMLRDGDTDLMRAAYRDFEPALPVTEEGVLSAVAGFFLGWAALILPAGFWRSVRRRRPGRPLVRT